jgi:hypothetical protein
LGPNPSTIQQKGKRTMKKLFVISLIVALFLATAVPALAAGGPRGGSASFTAAGVITALDGSTQTVTLRVVSGNPLAQPWIGQPLTVQTNGATLFLMKTSAGTVAIAFSDLAAGQNISVQGSVVDNVWTAQRITVGAQLIHQ